MSGHMTMESFLKAFRRRTAILALLALLLGQWVSLTHVHEQNATSPDGVCWLCFHAQHDGNAIPATAMALQVIPVDTPRSQSEYVRPSLAVSRYFNPRAPPLS